MSPDKICAAEIAALCQETGMLAARKNRYVILPRDFEKGYRSNVKKPALISSSTSDSGENVSKLVDLYKGSSEEWSHKAVELEGVIKALELPRECVWGGNEEEYYSCEALKTMTQ
ncbi:UNVERIFIED_CONTAM: 26S proteasome regulatory subunitB [Sesamum calycinum]|uniref:26S proteasome regulatory subunitB n=1 Tax=Sesamum calycinum TaxID=2727403 RepID=A0AAW2K866_9LAMI